VSCPLPPPLRPFPRHANPAAAVLAKGRRLASLLPFASLLLSASIFLPSIALPNAAHAAQHTAKKHPAAHGHAHASQTHTAAHVKAHAGHHSTGHSVALHRVVVTRDSHGRRHIHRVVIVKRRSHHRALSAREVAKTAQLQHAFVASTELRPMAQQLGNYRSPAAYAGVESYAHSHSGPAAAAAYLALGHAYLLDHRYPESLQSLASANAAGNTLDDYADYFAAQADLQSNQLPAADTILRTFAAKYPDSVFTPSIPVLEANLLLQQNQAAQALQILQASTGTAIAAKPDYQLAMAKADTALNQGAQALTLYRRILEDSPLSVEAHVAQQQLQSTGQWLSLPESERRHHADALFIGGHYNDAALEFRVLAADSTLTDAERDGLLLSAATCDFKLRRLSAGSLSGIPDSNDDNGAHRLYLLMEVARNGADQATQQSLVNQLRSRFPSSTWFAEALLSSGNMYMLKRDYLTAVPYYSELAQRFPDNKDADNAHWRAAWLEYRLRNFPEAERLMDEQITKFSDGKNLPAALYWRGRLYLDQQQQPATAAAYFSTEIRVYDHFYYAAIARQRLASIGTSVVPATIPMLDAMQPEQIPTLTEDVPQDDPHLAKARLLANAGLNDYLSTEIHAAEGSDAWGSLAEAKLYASFGEAYRAMRSLKRAIPFYTSAPIDELPLDYWRILFPQEYWSTIQQESARNGLDPYMVASLIRQESEFNPRVVSYANAWGLMQMLPSVGREMARKTGYSTHLDTDALLDPQINIKLGCVYLKQMLDDLGGQPEYAFAAYNAGESRVQDWRSAGDYTGIDEFVESIPFTQTRDYVQAILRNEQIYRELDQAAKTRAAIAEAAAGGISAQ
jgi:soluble lytic murein transglycosylase